MVREVTDLAIHLVAYTIGVLAITAMIVDTCNQWPAIARLIAEYRKS